MPQCLRPDNKMPIDDGTADFAARSWERKEIVSDLILDLLADRLQPGLIQGPRQGRRDHVIMMVGVVL